ncbi:hypothetical protein LEP1GSC165_0972 [Leptospira santarosai str. CBC523]|nr:hypothetical protein LEP1GSC165_0972 [Leptospira santarosai str. CBC523]
MNISSLDQCFYIFEIIAFIYLNKGFLVSFFFSQKILKSNLRFLLHCVYHER